MVISSKTMACSTKFEITTDYLAIKWRLFFGGICLFSTTLGNGALHSHSEVQFLGALYEKHSENKTSA